MFSAVPFRDRKKVWSDSNGKEREKGPQHVYISYFNLKSGATLWIMKLSLISAPSTFESAL